jgi:hypothetical protein
MPRRMGRVRQATTRKDQEIRMRLCEVSGCEQKHFGKGLCSKHYERVRRNGSTDMVTYVVDGDVDLQSVTRRRLERNSKRVGECIEYTGTLETAGYGVIQISRKRTKAHRVSFELHNGPIPEGMMVRHKCDNPPCINPAHLTLGGQQENMSDMVERGRSLPGERQPNAKLTDAQALEIIARLQDGEGQRALSREFGVSHTTVNEIALNKRWTHLPRIAKDAA